MEAWGVGVSKLITVVPVSGMAAGDVGSVSKAIVEALVARSVSKAVGIKVVAECGLKIDMSREPKVWMLLPLIWGWWPWLPTLVGN